MKIETKFNVGDIVYYLVDKQNIKKGKIEKIIIAIEDENYSLANKTGKDTIYIEYSLDNCVRYLKQQEIFKDFEDFRKTFQLKFEELNNTKLKEYLNNYKTNNEN